MNNRGQKGRFTKGNSGGPGRPSREVETGYLAAMAAGVSVEDWNAITLRAVADAKRGDARARDWLSKYLVGEQLAVDVLHETAPQIVLMVPDNGRGPKPTSAEVSGDSAN